VSDKLSTIINKYIEWIYEDTNFWTDADQRIQKCIDIANSEDLDEIEKFKLDFFTTITQWRLDFALTKKAKNWDIINSAISSFKKKKLKFTKACKIQTDYPKMKSYKNAN
jgi:small-conductance mechanosensitive channel